MNSASNILAVHTLNESMWETTDDDNIGSLVSKEDLICNHFDGLHLDESDGEYDYEYDSNESINTPMAETVADKDSNKFLFNDAEELFVIPLRPPFLELGAAPVGVGVGVVIVVTIVGVFGGNFCLKFALTKLP